MKKVFSFVLAVVLAVGLFPCTAVATGTSGQVFSDVKPDAWYYEAVMGCYEAGLVNGVGNGKFEPNRPVTEAELVAMVHRVLAPEEDQNPAQTDSNWYSGYYNVWMTKFPAKLTWKNPRYQNLITDWSQFGKVGRLGTGGGATYDHLAISEDMWMEFVKEHAYNEDGTMKEMHLDTWNGGYKGVGLPKNTLYMPQHMQITSGEWLAYSFDDLNYLVFNYEGAKNPCTRFQAGFIIDEYIENYMNDVWMYAAEYNKINLLPMTYSHYLNDYVDMTKCPQYTVSTANMLYWGIFGGDDKGNFNGNSTITRAEAAQVIYNMTKLDLTKVPSNKFVDKMNAFEERRSYVEERVAQAVRNAVYDLWQSDTYRNYEYTKDCVGYYDPTGNSGCDEDRIVSEYIATYEMCWTNLAVHMAPQAVVNNCNGLSHNSMGGSCTHRHDSEFYHICENLSRESTCNCEMNFNCMDSSAAIGLKNDSGVAYTRCGFNYQYSGGEIIADANATSVMNSCWDDDAYVAAIAKRFVNAWVNSSGHKHQLLASLIDSVNNKNFAVFVGYGPAPTKTYGDFGYRIAVTGL